MFFEIKRIEKDSECTRGIFSCEGQLTGMYTLEPPDKNNQSDISCILPGTYLCKRHISPSKGEVFWLQGTYNRWYIYIGHKVNTVDDTLGCIGLGMDIGELSGKKAVLKSREAIERLFCLTSGLDTFWLRIE